MKTQAKQDGGSGDPSRDLPDSVTRNIDAVAGFYEAEERRISGPQDSLNSDPIWICRSTC
jgi:hypothetical protein